jgi:hypothetical protein
MKKQILTLICISFYAFINAQNYTSGTTNFGANQYTEFRVGNLPIIITAPHGGRLEPTSIPDRNCATCTTVMDANTMELAYQIDTALRQEFGCFPNIVVNRLHRIKCQSRNCRSGEWFGGGRNGLARVASVHSSRQKRYCSPIWTRIID